MLDERRRLDVLAALGIEVYRLRAVAAPPAGAGPDPAMAAPADPDAVAPAVTPTRSADGKPLLVIACAPGMRRDRRSMQRIAQILRAIGTAEPAAVFIEVDTGAARFDIPDVPAYLMLGAAVARACSAQLSLGMQDAAAIAVIDDPAEPARDGAAKRALWHSLKPLARRARRAAE